MLRNRLEAVIPLLIGGALTLLVLEAFDVQDGAIAGATYAVVTVAVIATLRWAPRHHAVVLQRPGGTRRIVRRWGPYLTLPGYERHRDTVDLRPVIVHEPKEPLIIRDNLVVLAELELRFRVHDVARAVDAAPRPEPLVLEHLGRVLRSRGGQFRPDRALLDAAREYLRPAVATTDLETLQERTPQLVDGLRRTLDARAAQWGLVIEEATISFPPS